MAIIFGSTEANEVLKTDREIARRIADLQNEYDSALEELRFAEDELSDAESKYRKCQRDVLDIEKFAKAHGVILD